MTGFDCGLCSTRHTNGDPMCPTIPDPQPIETLRGRTLDGSALQPGVNVDGVDIGLGKEAAARFGYGDWQAQMLVEIALQRHARGEESSAMRLWLSEYPNDLGSWYIILAHAVTAAT